MANPNPSPETRFADGNPGGPGVPKGTVSLTTELKEFLRENPDQAAGLIRDTIANARAGNGVALKLVFDRIDGPTTQNIDMTIRDLGKLSDELLKQAYEIASVLEDEKQGS